MSEVTREFKVGGAMTMEGRGVVELIAEEDGKPVFRSVLEPEACAALGLRLITSAACVRCDEAYYRALAPHLPLEAITAIMATARGSA